MRLMVDTIDIDACSEYVTEKFSRLGCAILDVPESKVDEVTKILQEMNVSYEEITDEPIAFVAYY